jgi:hypothetical protein
MDVKKRFALLSRGKETDARDFMRTIDGPKYRLGRHFIGIARAGNDLSGPNTAYENDLSYGNPIFFCECLNAIGYQIALFKAHHEDSADLSLTRFHPGSPLTFGLFPSLLRLHNQRQSQ